jgi:hypothetical protein
MFSIIGYLLNKWWIWPEATQKNKNKKLLGFHQFLNFLKFFDIKQIISRKFSISKKNNLIITEPEKGTTVLTFVIHPSILRF